MQDLYGLNSPTALANRDQTPENTSIATSGSSPPPLTQSSSANTSEEDIKMEEPKTDTKDEYQISTRSGGLYQRSTKQQSPIKLISPNKLNKNSRSSKTPSPPPLPLSSSSSSSSSSTSSIVAEDTEIAQTIEQNPSNNNKNDENSNNNNNNNMLNENHESTDLSNTDKIISEDLVNDNDEIVNKSNESLNSDTELNCNICQKVFNSNASLERHLVQHTNEKPFRCKICTLAFTTNRILKRHMRATHNNHSFDDESEEDGSSSSSTDSSNQTIKQLRKSQRMKRRYEYNNNNNYNKRKINSLTDDDVKTNRRRFKVNNSDNNLQQKYHCPICKREDFASLNVFETHLEDIHPEYQVKCEQCDLGFKNHRVLNLHRFMVHHENVDSDLKTPQIENSSKKSIMGFKDLTFVDFSSEKFPIIAKTICEQSMHCPVNKDDLNFQCQKCKHSFPCTSALEIHQDSCLNGTNHSSSSSESMSEEDIKRSDFFAGLNLQTKAPENRFKDSEDDTTITTTFIPKIRLKPFATKPELLLTPPNKSLVDTTKDLADIQSIISVTSAQSLLQQLTVGSKSTPANIQLPLSLTQMTPPDSQQRLIPEMGTLMTDYQQSIQQPDEEQQDQFASEFRKMKLRGEFPCRLCTAVFPNLRALKGHNRAHLTGNGNGPYRCNMCPHSSNDKAALVRHMRTHNGDRPYECSLCNYAFTTKANCERHLRNRHRKVTREEVKRSIIYHPSEDPTNDESLVSAANVLKGLTPPPSTLRIRNEEYLNTKITHDVKRSLIFTPPTIVENSNSSSSQLPDLYTKMQVHNNSIKEELPIKTNLSALKEHRIFPKLSGALNLSNGDIKHEPNTPLTVPKIQVKNFNELKQTPESPKPNNQSDSEPEDNYTNQTNLMSTPLSHFTKPHNSPIDLSMDVLDLSKKRRDPSPEPEIIQNVANTELSDTDEPDDVMDEAQPQDLSKKTLNRNQSIVNSTLSQPPPNASFFEKTQFLLAQHLLKRGNGASTNTPSPVLPPSFYASQLQNFYNIRPPGASLGTTPTQFPGFGLNPYFLQPNPFLTPTASPQEFQEMKERIQKEIIQGLQMSGGGLIMDHLATERLQAFQKQNNDSVPDFPIKNTDEPIKSELNTPSAQFNSPLKSNIGSTKIAENILSHTPNSVKMVIKNGVLMPKQKQRRYRTERPFSCEHCSARFTLRSNMERHIKQQHPQFWSQRQRSNMSAGIPGRKPSLQVLPTLQPQQQPPSSVPPSSTTNFNLQKEIPPNFTIPNLTDLNKQPLLISEQVKFAILAQQLKQQIQNNANLMRSQEHSDLNSNPVEKEDEDDNLVIDENSQVSVNDDKATVNKTESPEANQTPMQTESNKKSLEQKMTELRLIREKLLKQQEEEALQLRAQIKSEPNTDEVKQKEESVRNEDLVPVAKLLDNANAAQIPFRQYFRRDTEDTETPSEEDEEGLVASGSTSEGNLSGSDGNRSESEVNNMKKKSHSNDEKNQQDKEQTAPPAKKKSAYSLAPNRVTCPYCHRKFPWSSSLRRHILTHTGQKPFKCSHCPLLFTTKSNCDRHLLRKHGNLVTNNNNNNNNNNHNNNNSNVTINAPTLVPTSVNDGNNPSNYMMRNVPERPYKCSNCPSSTFSTINNLKKHINCKHNVAMDTEEPRSATNNRKNSYDSHSSEDEYNIQQNTVQKLIKTYKNDWEQQINTNVQRDDIKPVGLPQQTTTDLPFKCHLCDSSYGERQDALDHIKDQHTNEFELLMSKGALDTHSNSADSSNPNQSDNNSAIDQTNSDEQDEQTHLRGKFPDYANRKVMCAFCMRRFWSAEDLRRHMRTHTGERPFSCDVCRRRFTLKHSMLRHRKKHNLNGNSSDELLSHSARNSIDSKDDERDNFDSISKGNEHNNNVLHLKSGLGAKESLTNGDESEGSGDLISNLLGIRDSSIIDQVLRSSADDAAKLLGVNNKINE